ncbi:MULTISPECIES: 2-phospho-L-lactate guanylyltransferase [Halorussus]|uniref:2-phospho-L-lactate guanylyltransferase n=1 Tax=Halorussus TaxID=1070314 RepID=UPI00209D10AC|nr:2-phospho-L-lactate guanylyltransferase [Halorussus vallis]USZ77526.1 2-phospho-L-lactate guanylyltransferase [Halorussus vallis]
MRVVVPYAAEEPKTRLADALSPEERVEFAAAMLADVLATVRAAGREPEVLATAPVAADAPVTVDERALTPAVDAALAETDDPVAVVMADLALATPEALSRLFDASRATDPDEGADVVLAPGRGGGTNAMVVAHPEFRTDYHGASYLDHLARAREVDASVATVDSHRLATDVDERVDLAEVLVHSDGRACAWLADAGFVLSTDGGRVRAVRE